jgi:cell division septation protein DedD
MLVGWFRPSTTGLSSEPPRTAADSCGSEPRARTVAADADQPGAVGVALAFVIGIEVKFDPSPGSAGYSQRNRPRNLLTARQTGSPPLPTSPGSNETPSEIDRLFIVVRTCDTPGRSGAPNPLGAVAGWS